MGKKDIVRTYAEIAKSYIERGYIPFYEWDNARAQAM